LNLADAWRAAAVRHLVAPEAAAWQHIGGFGGVAQRFEATGAKAEASERLNFHSAKGAAYLAGV